MKSVAIIGAGITGLTTAFYLKRRGVDVSVYEGGSRVGGVIQSICKDGFLAEAGPNTLLETSPKITQLIRDAGLEQRRLNTDPAAEARFVVRYGRPIQMPGGPLGFLATPLFSPAAKLAFVREPFVQPRRDGVEESIAQFVVRRFNREFLDHAVDALVAGIYAGDPEKLSLTHAFPRLKALEDNYGSMVKGQFLGARDRKKSGEVARNRAPKLSFDDGLQVLTDGLAAYLGEAVKLNTSVNRLVQTDAAWKMECFEKNEARNFEAVHDVVIYCGTAHRLADLKINTLRSDALNLQPFSEIRHPAVASVILGFRREDVAHPCQGFGMLIPKVEGFNILGTIFSSALFPNRAPKGHVLLTSYVGGERQPELALLPPEKLVELVTADLRKLLGVRAAPVFTHCVCWPRAIPQYNVGYGRFKDLLTQIEATTTRLFFAGSYRDGISLGDSIVSGVNMADRVATILSPV